MTSVPVKFQPVEIMERVGETSFNIDQNKPHIEVDTDICRKCPHQMCQYGCPTQCYKADESDVRIMHFNYEGCVECGTCDVLCDQGAVTWNMPRGGFGVQYKYG